MGYLSRGASEEASHLVYEEKLHNLVLRPRVASMSAVLSVAMGHDGQPSSSACRDTADTSSSHRAAEPQLPEEAECTADRSRRAPMPSP